MSTTKAWRCNRCLPDGTCDHRDDLPCYESDGPECLLYEVYVVPIAEAQAYEPGISGVSDHLIIPVPEVSA